MPGHFLGRQIVQYPAQLDRAITVQRDDERVRAVTVVQVVVNPGQVSGLIWASEAVHVCLAGRADD
jgi:hypothetical protein